MKLTSENVTKVFMNCLFESGEDTASAIMAEGIAVLQVGFHPFRLGEHQKDIFELLSQLPDGFKKSSGGGQSFLNMCNDNAGGLWTGEHSIMEQLLLLGLACRYISYILPRTMWSAFPHGMPFLVINDN